MNNLSGSGSLFYHVKVKKEKRIKNKTSKYIE